MAIPVQQRWDDVLRQLQAWGTLSQVGQQSMSAVLFMLEEALKVALQSDSLTYASNDDHRSCDLGDDHDDDNGDNNGRSSGESHQARRSQCEPQRARRSQREPQRARRSPRRARRSDKPRRARRSQGGAQRTYCVGEDGLVTYNEDRWGICSLASMSLANVKATLRDAAGSDIDQHVALAIHSIGGATLASPARSLSAQLSDLQHLSEVFNPTQTSPPADLTKEGLANWSCSQHVHLLQSLMSVSGSVKVLVDFHVGKYIDHLLGGGGSSEQLFARLCTEAHCLLTKQYRDLLQACGCSDHCVKDLEWLDGRNPTDSRPGACKATLIKAKFLTEKYKNLTPTFLRQCKLLHASISHHHPLLTKCEITCPTRVRIMVPEVAKLVKAAEHMAQFSALPLVRYSLNNVFPVDPELAIQAIDYVDGDGGWLIATYIPGLCSFIQRMGEKATNVRTINDEPMNLQLVAFREVGHDAVEIGHVYHCEGDFRGRAFGADALRMARANIASSDVVYICCQTEVDSSGKRLLLEVLTHSNNVGPLTSNGEILISAGLSVPFDNSPASYKMAHTYAQDNKRGLYGYFPTEVANASAFQPQMLRRSFSTGDSGSRKVVTVQHEGREFSVRPHSNSNTSLLRHESHVCIRKSTISDAGLGLFLRAWPGPERVFVQKEKYLCMYSERALAREERARVEGGDYVIEVSGGAVFNASSFNGTNIARFANQGNLQPAFKKMVKVSRKDQCYAISPQWGEVERVADEACNVKYKKGHGGLALVPTKNIELRPSSIELLANYSIKGYWVPYFSLKARELGVCNENVASILWCACSPDSNWAGSSIQSEVHDLLHIQGLNPEDYSTLQCPWP